VKILLTGANGFLGRYVKEHIQQCNILKTLGRSAESDYTCDLSSEIPILDNDLSVVIHIAGKAHKMPKSLEEAEDFYKVNVQGTANLLKASESAHPIKSFIFISTVAVYGLSHGNLINEDAPLCANDPYGLSKIQAENLVQEWCKKQEVICTILRLPLVVGSNPPGNLGAMINGINRGYYFNIAGGTARKSLVLASDVAQCILKVAQIGGIFNLTDGYHPSFFELSENISRQLGKSRAKNLPFWFATGLARTGDLFGDKVPLNSAKLYKITSDLTFDDSKAREAFGWDPTPVLEGFMISDKN
jgi:nucleoside-diphosphate-sugar epimerase